MHLRASPLVLAVIAASCAAPPGKKKAESPPPAEAVQTAPGEPAPEPAQGDDLEPMLPPLDKQDLVVGTGPAAQKGDRVLVHYRGTLLDGTQFDSSIDRGTPFEFDLGGGQVIPGWELGVAGMQKGGKRKLRIPPHLGYGSRGSPPKIPPEAVLLFEVELLEILPK